MRACSRQTPASARRATAQATRRWRRCPRAAHVARVVDVGDEDSEPVAAAVGREKQPAVRQPRRRHAAAAARRRGRRATRPVAGSTSTISDRLRCRHALDGNPSARQATSGARQKCTPGSETSGTGRRAAAARAEPQRRELAPIGALDRADDRRAPSGDTSGSPARAPCVRRRGPPPSAVDRVEIRLQPDLVLDLHLIEDNLRTPQTQARCPDTGRPACASWRRAWIADEQRRKAVRVDDRVVEPPVRSESRTADGEPVLRQPRDTAPPAPSASPARRLLELPPEIAERALEDLLERARAEVRNPACGRRPSGCRSDASP